MKHYFLFAIMGGMLLLSRHAESQVTIGSSVDVNKGSLLDLKENNNLGANSEKGLLLPRVMLHKKAQLSPGENIEFTGDDVHVGLTVYNLKDDVKEDLCPGPYVWTGTYWDRLWGPCLCEYSILGKDGKIYYVYCKDFATTPDNAAAQCKSAEVTNRKPQGGTYTYHLMTYDEYRQIWWKPEVKSGEYLFVTGQNYYISYTSSHYDYSSAWLTIGKLYDEGSFRWGEVIGVGRAQSDILINDNIFSGGMPIGSALSGSYTVRCVRDSQ